jgi:hypothetical protein
VWPLTAVQYKSFPYLRCKCCMLKLIVNGSVYTCYVVSRY